VTKVILKMYSSVGIMTGCGLDDRGPIPVKGFLFSTASRPALEPTQIPIQCLLGDPSRRVKRTERDVDQSSPSSS
jgi:hypothetical protein